MSDMTPVDSLASGLSVLKKYGATDFEVEEDCEGMSYIYVQAKSEPSEEDSEFLMGLGWNWYYGDNPNGTFTVYKDAWTLSA